MPEKIAGSIQCTGYALVDTMHASCRNFVIIDTCNFKKVPSKIGG